MLYQLVCKICGNTFTTEKKDRKICSRACYDSNPRGVKTATLTKCKCCGKEFSIIPSRLNSGRGTYCSRECRSKDKELIFNCAYCGKESKSYISRQHKNKYCSKECHIQAEFIETTRKGKDHYNYKGARHSNTYRREAFAIHGEKCNRCGATELLTVHHIDHNHWNNAPDGSNWEILCKKCHSDHHALVQSLLPKMYNRTCPYCNKAFIAPNAHQKHCSRSCATKHQHKRRRESLVNPVF